MLRLSQHKPVTLLTCFRFHLPMTLLDQTSYIHACQLNADQSVNMALFDGLASSKEVSKTKQIAADAVGSEALFRRRPNMVPFSYTFQGVSLDGVVFWDPDLESDDEIRQPSECIAVPASLVEAGVGDLERALQARLPPRCWLRPELCALYMARMQHKMARETKTVMDIVVTGPTEAQQIRLSVYRD